MLPDMVILSKLTLEYFYGLAIKGLYFSVEKIILSLPISGDSNSLFRHIYAKGDEVLIPPFTQIKI